MHHAMSSSDQTVVLKLACYPAQERGECIVMGGAFYQIFIREGRSCVVRCNEMYPVSYAVEFTVADEALAARPRMPFKERELETG